MSQNFGVSDTIYYTKIYDRINQVLLMTDFTLELCKEIEGSVLETLLWNRKNYATLTKIRHRYYGVGLYTIYA